MNRRKAPWPDYAGNPIHEGDNIVHPSGERGKVFFTPGDDIAPEDAWRVGYDAHHAPLHLQVGDEHKGVVKNLPVASWSAHLFCDCPECEENVDLLDEPDFWDGRTAPRPLEGAKNVNVMCPNCGHEFEVDVEW